MDEMCYLIGQSACMSRHVPSRPSECLLPAPDPTDSAVCPLHASLSYCVSVLAPFYL